MTTYSLGGKSPILPPGFCFIADSAEVIGDVEIGEDVGIWFNAVLRGDNERITIGARTNIQDGCVCHTDWGFPLIVGEGCTIGHKAMLHGCVIGENTLVGMSATILNGAKIGKNCLIGAGTLVREGMDIPDNSLVVGVPGKVVRELGADSEQAFRDSAKHYAENARRFASDLKRIDRS